jgi:hypothetical protein
MNPSLHLRLTFAACAIATGLFNTALAQSTADTSSVSAPETTTVTPTTVTTPAVIAGSEAAAQAPAATIETPSQPGPIGSTGLGRADSANIAFLKLDIADRGFLSRSDVAQLPGFGDAFAQADGDGDGRLDRTEFADAWAAYVNRAQSPDTVTTTTTNTPAR